MPSLLVRSLILGAGFAMAVPRSAVAQTARSRALAAPVAQQPASMPTRRNAFSIETAVHDAFTIAGNFSYFSPDDYTRSSFELKGRLYPNELAPQGFSVGFGVGGVNTRETISVDGIDERQDQTSPAIGVYVDYNWLLGRSNRFLVGTGLGAKRILHERDEFENAPRVYGTARFLIGVAF
jgi:hypothetical protein